MAKQNGKPRSAKNGDCTVVQSKVLDLETRQALYRAVPACDWRLLTGRHPSQLSQQAALYGLPITGASIDLFHAISGLFDLLGRFARGRKPPAEQAEIALLAGGDSPALERYREARAKLSELELSVKEGRSVDIELIRPLLFEIAGLIRDAGERLQQRYGREAREILDHSIDACEDRLLRFFGEDNAHLENGGPDAFPR